MPGGDRIPRHLEALLRNGDKPTENQFHDLIDSFISRIDDGLTIGLAPDATGGAARYDVNAVIGSGSTYLDYTLMSGFSDDWPGQSGFLAFSFVQDSQTHYGYVQISSDVPGATNPYAMYVEYLEIQTV